MSKTTRYLLVALAAGLMVSSAAPAQAESLSLVGVGNFSNMSFSNLPAGTAFSTSTKFGLGGGALLDFRLAPGTMFEVGALYVTKKFSDSTNTAYDSNYLQIPVLVKFRLLPMFAIGVGGFGERGVGTPTTTNSAGTTSNASFSTLSDFGLEGSVGLHLPLTMTTRLLIEGRYLYGLTNLDTDNDGVTEQYRDIQALVGLTFALGGGEGRY